MNAPAMIFTMWIGSFDVNGTYIGRAFASDRSCKDVASVRPTMDAEFDVIDEDTTTANMVRRNS